MKHGSLRENLFAVSVLIGVGVLVAGLKVMFGFSAGISAGIFAGSMTNTPALANMIQYLREHVSATSDQAVKIFSEPVVAYSLCYPLGVLGVIGGIYVMQRVWKVDYKAEMLTSAQNHEAASLMTLTVKITNPEACHDTLGELSRKHNWNVRFVRWLHQGKLWHLKARMSSKVISST